MKALKVKRSMPKAATLRRLINLWPPFLFAGIRVLEFDSDFDHVRVRLRSRLLTRNYVGTHFGGSLFAMTDPFWMLLMMRRLGHGYRVWDRAASIEFIAAVREPVYASLVLPEHCVGAIQHACRSGEPVTRWFEAPIETADGVLVARVRKQLFVRAHRVEECQSESNPARPVDTDVTGLT